MVGIAWDLRAEVNSSVHFFGSRHVAKGLIDDRCAEAVASPNMQNLKCSAFEVGNADVAPTKIGLYARRERHAMRRDECERLLACA